MDEFGVHVGCLSGEIVIVSTHKQGLYTASPENRESPTIIETICADGQPPIPPIVFCPSEEIMESWVSNKLLGAEVIAVSQTGYTNKKIALAWLDHFIKHVDPGPDKHWRMPLLDGHNTHHKADFILQCHENHIVPFAFPSHPTHVLQLLDVGVFRPWKHYHNKAIHNVLHSLDMEYRISSFFRDLSSIREQTFRPHTIHNAFKDSGMFPVAFKKAWKKMRHYNARRNLKDISGANTSSSPDPGPSILVNSTETEVSIEEGGEL